MLSKAEKRILLVGGVLIVTGVLLLISRSVAPSPWVWAGFLSVAGLGALGLYLADRTDGPMLLAAYLLGATAGLIALVPTDLLRNEAIACYVLLAIALPFLAIFLRDRARWWALIPAYPLLVVAGAVGLAASGLVSDDLISASVVLALALPFLAVFARDREQLWALIPGGFLTVLGLSLSSWLPWHAVRSTFVTGGGAGYAVGLGLLVAGAAVLVRVVAGRNRSSGVDLS
ncbi:MAG: hypothetical protein PVI67_13830 [Anaerolineae bacterium]|jgi:uncharacterized membrane protein YqaE (UPF0057 family)